MANNFSVNRLSPKTKISTPTNYETIFIDQKITSISSIYSPSDSISIYSDLIILSKNKKSYPVYKMTGEKNTMHKDNIKSIRVYSAYISGVGSDFATELSLEDLKWINGYHFESKFLGGEEVCQYYIYATDSAIFDKAKTLLDELENVIVPENKNNMEGRHNRDAIFKTKVRELKKHKILVASYCMT